MLSVPYAPHQLVFERASAIVHQGGVGTTAQAMRSGRPMLVVPFAHDQYDNAERMRKLGVAETLSRPDYNARSAASKLSNVLSKSAAAGALSERVRRERGAECAADALLA